MEERVYRTFECSDVDDLRGRILKEELDQRRFQRVKIEVLDIVCVLIKAAGGQFEYKL